jgi:hypothetical protein
MHTATGRYSVVFFRDNVLVYRCGRTALVVFATASLVSLAACGALLKPLPLCNGGKTRPFSQAQIVREFRRANVLLQAQRRHANCEDKSVAEVVSTSLHDYYRQGDVICTLQKRPTATDKVDELLEA